MASGEAFWIFTAGGSDYAGPMHVEVAAGDGVDFGGSLTQLDVALTNRGAAPAAYSARLLTPGPISYQTFDAAEIHFIWTDLAAGAVITAEPAERALLSLAVRRADLAGAVFESIIEITDSAGSRRLLPLSALELDAVSPLVGRAARALKVVAPFAGLWAGTASLDQVSDPSDAAALAPTVSSTFDLRVLIHVDSAGQARLLKEVIQMWEDGVGGADGHFVLVTDEAQIFNFEGAALADGEQVGRRVSTAGYDFDDASADWEAATRTLRLTGAFGPAGVLSTTIILPPTHPSNPFYHRYHPDHDHCGCDPEDTVCVDGCAESFELQRTITLTFAADTAAGLGLRSTARLGGHASPCGGCRCLERCLAPERPGEAGAIRLGVQCGTGRLSRARPRFVPILLEESELEIIAEFDEVLG